MKRKLLIAVIGLGAIAALVALLPMAREPLLAAANWAESSPQLAWPLFIVSFVIAIVTMVPGWLFMVAAGYLFGFLAGGVLAFIANLLGSIVAFLLARSYLRHWVKNKIDHSPRFNGFDRAVSRNGLYTVMFARFAMLPNNLINYACGVTGMGLRDFVFGTAAGCLPILVANVLIGAGTVDLFTTIESGEFRQERPPFLLFGAVAALVVVIVLLAKHFGTRLADSAPESAGDSGDISPRS